MIARVSVILADPDKIDFALTRRWVYPPMLTGLYTPFDTAAEDITGNPGAGLINPVLRKNCVYQFRPPSGENCISISPLQLPSISIEKDTNSPSSIVNVAPVTLNVAVRVSEVET